MTSLKKTATIRWLTHPPEGVPRLSVGSDSFRPMPLNIDPDAAHPLATSPGELLAGAIGAFFALLAAKHLADEGTQARELTANVILRWAGEAEDFTDLTLSEIECEFRGYIAGIDQDHMEAIAEEALARCLAGLGIRTEGTKVAIAAVLQGA